MPLHRVLDLAILICKTKKVFMERYRKNEKDYDKYRVLERIGIQGNAMNVAVCTENEEIEGDIELFEKCLSKDDELISERLRILGSLIDEIDKG